jgi:hypothetical protein
MPYRTNEHLAHALEEQKELRDLAEGTRARRARTAVALSALLLGGAAGVVALGTRRPAPSSPTRCHHVEIRWENAPGREPRGWTSCGEHAQLTKGSAGSWHLVGRMKQNGVLAVLAVVKVGHS